MVVHREKTFWAVAAMVALGLALTFVCACSRTSTYLPAPPTPDSERLTLEEVKEHGWFWVISHPFSDEWNAKGLWYKIGSFLTFGH